jgi:hypothetical protein
MNDPTANDLRLASRAEKACNEVPEGLNKRVRKFV